MNWVDLIILAVLAFAACLGFQKGFVKQFATLASLVLGVCMAGKHHCELARSPSLSFLAREYGERTAVVAAYIGIFIAIILVAQIAAAVVQRAIKGKVFEPLDRVLGGVIGLAKVYAACGLLAVGMLQFLPDRGFRSHLADSYLAPRMAQSLERAAEELPQAYRAELRDFFDRAPQRAGSTPSIQGPGPRSWPSTCITLRSPPSGRAPSPCSASTYR